MATKTKAADAVKLPDEKRETFRTVLRVALRPEEIADRADRAAQMIQTRDNKEAEAKSAAKHAKSEIESLDSQIRSLSNEVRTKSTYAGVECERTWNYVTGMYQEVRLDTGEVVTERRLTTAELQRDLPFAGEANGAAHGGDDD